MSTFTEEQLKQINYTLEKVLISNIETLSEHLADQLRHPLNMNYSTLKRALYSPVDLEVKYLRAQLFKALKSIEKQPLKK